MADIAKQRWILIRNIIIYLENQISPKSEDFCILGGHFGLKMADIANQRSILIRNIIIYLENQISPKSEDFCILAANLDSKLPP